MKLKSFRYGKQETESVVQPGRGGAWGGGQQEAEEEGRENISQHCVIFCNRKSKKRRETQRKGREPGRS